MNATLSPELVIQRQFDAFNAMDIEAWLSTYAEDAVQYQHPRQLLASGHAAIRARMLTRFSDPHLRAELLKRTVLNNVVIDHEWVYGSSAEGATKTELVALYVVEAGLIQEATFIFGDRVALAD